MDVDTELYLRDGFPFVTVCKVQLKDGRIGIGVFRQVLGQPGELGVAAADAAALADALENVQDVAAARAERDITTHREPAMEPRAPAELTVYDHDPRNQALLERDHDLQTSLGCPPHD